MRVALLVALAALSVVPTRAMVQPPRLAEMLDTYLRGDYDDALKQAAGIGNLGAFRLRYVQEAPTWVASEPAAIKRRRAVAASFLLELTHARLESDWGRL